MSVFSTPPPDLSLQEARSLLADLFGLSANLTPLYSERDQNFLCTLPDRKCVLKISNSEEEKDVLKMQNACLDYIHDKDPDLKIPLPIDEIKEHNGSYIRLVEYLEGQFLMDVEHQQNLLFELGQFLGQLRSAMDGFDHPSGHRYFEWNVRNIDFIKEQKHNLDNNEFLIDHFLEQYEINVLPFADDLRTSMNHNDGNTHNVLVDEKGDMKGIIDFGDMIHTFTACEPAVCMAYVALEKKDPFSEIANVLQGFHLQYPLTDLELSKVVYLMCMRLCITLTMAAHRMKLFPENEYISVDYNQAFHFLTKMKNEDLESWSGKLVKYCGS